MHKKIGFTLIEVIIALLLSCMLIGFVMTSLGLLQRGIRSAYPLMQHTQELVNLYQQLLSDIEGMCLPVSLEQSKAIEKVCWSNSEQQHLTYFTFISNNPLQFYSDQHSNNVHLVRVAYFLKKHDNTYDLYRAQSNSLYDWSEQKMSKYGYKICGSIRHIDISFYASYYKNREQNKSLYETKVWDYEELSKKNTSLAITKIPQWVRLSITFEHTAEPYVIDIEIPIYDSLLNIKQEAEDNKKENTVAPKKILKPSSELQGVIDQIKNMQSKAGS